MSGTREILGLPDFHLVEEEDYPHAINFMGTTENEKPVHSDYILQGLLSVSQLH